MRRVRVETPFWVLAVSLGFTVAATYAFHQAVAARDTSRFASAVAATQDRIASRLDTYVAMLLATRGLFSGSEEVTHEEFRVFVEQLELGRRYPGVQGIGFSRRVVPAEAPAVVERMREEGFPEFRIWPDPPRQELHTILFLEPLDRRNRAALGYDMFTEPTRREAMERARDTRQPAASRRVTLVQEIDEHKQAGFLLYVPVFRHAELVGFVYSPFRADDLFAGIFGSETMPRVGFEVHDGPIAAENLMHRSESNADAGRPRFTRTAAITVGGSTWTLRFYTRAIFESQSNRALVPVFFGIGVLLSTVLFAMTRGLSRARAEAEAQRRNLQLLFTQAPAAVAVLRGAELRYELSNPLNVRFSGGRARPGVTVREAMPEHHATLEPLIEQVMRSGESWVGTEVPIRLKSDGGERQAYLSGTYQPLRDAAGRIEGVMAFAYEVTDLVVARQKVEAALRARDDFLSVAGHELRTPITALSLQLQGLLRQLDKGTVDAARLGDRLRKALNHIVRIERLVSDLLDVSRISSGRLSLLREPVDLAALVAEVADRFGDAAAAAGCDLRVGVGPGIVGAWDRSRVDQVLTNLVSNALKYGAGKPVELHAGVVGERAFVTVRDRGIGIAAEDRERIFERFERAVSGQSYGGLGLGLWISRQIVTALGGTIRVADSAPGQGSELRVELPLAAPPTPA